MGRPRYPSSEVVAVTRRVVVPVEYHQARRLALKCVWR